MKPRLRRGIWSKDEPPDLVCGWSGVALESAYLLRQGGGKSGSSETYLQGFADLACAVSWIRQMAQENRLTSEKATQLMAGVFEDLRRHRGKDERVDGILLLPDEMPGAPPIRQTDPDFSYRQYIGFMHVPEIYVHKNDYGRMSGRGGGPARKRQKTGEGPEGTMHMYSFGVPVEGDPECEQQIYTELRRDRPDTLPGSSQKVVWTVMKGKNVVIISEEKREGEQDVAISNLFFEKGFKFSGPTHLITAKPLYNTSCSSLTATSSKPYQEKEEQKNE